MSLIYSRSRVLSAANTHLLGAMQQPGKKFVIPAMTIKKKKNIKLHIPCD